MGGQTRRELILRGASAAGIGAASGGLAEAAMGTPAAGAAGSPSTDVQELHSLALVEQLIAFAYNHLVDVASLSAATAATLRSFLAHEREHVRLLSAGLDELGQAPPAIPSDVDGVSRQLKALQVPGNLGSVKAEADALHYLIGVETLAEGAYYSSMSRLSSDRLLVLAAQVMSCEAQHWTALSGLLHAGDVYRAVPYPVVLG